MSPKLLIRIAAGCILFFALGHTMGHATRKTSTDPEAVAVLKAMEGYKFPIGPQMRSYDEFYTGMSLNLILTLIVVAAALWILSNATEASPDLVSRILAAFFALFTGFTATSALYFFIAPLITCALAGVLCAAAWWRLRT